jgi:hypothetical protein
MIVAFEYLFKDAALFIKRLNAAFVSASGLSEFPRSDQRSRTIWYLPLLGFGIN